MSKFGGSQRTLWPIQSSLGGETGMTAASETLITLRMFYSNNNKNNKLHLYLTSAIFQSIYSKLKSLSRPIEALAGRRLSKSQ